MRVLKVIPLKHEQCQQIKVATCKDIPLPAQSPRSVVSPCRVLPMTLGFVEGKNRSNRLPFPNLPPCTKSFGIEHKELAIAEFQDSSVQARIRTSQSNRCYTLGEARFAWLLRTTDGRGSRAEGAKPSYIQLIHSLMYDRTVIRIRSHRSSIVERLC